VARCEHGEIVDAIRARDSLRVSQLMGDHIERFYRDAPTGDAPVAAS
jgi:DNA-binding GntR family transcriptional regulator